LSETSQNRININPLRILDDKIDGKKDFVKNAPMIDAFLTEKEKKDFEMICSVLKKLNVNFKIDKTLVRGLDYYSNFVFEFNSTCKELEGQPTLVGGGRYANLIKELSGKQDYSSIGFAVGIERIIIAANIEKIEIAEKQNIEVLVTNLSESTRFVSTCILQALRNKCISSVCNFDIIKLTKAFSYAKSINAMFIVIIGKKELENNEVIVKNQKTFKQTNVKIDDLIDFLKEEIKNYKNR
jgi:histidyl-tRNA synthetase